MTIKRKYATTGGTIRINEDRTFCQRGFLPYEDDVVLFHYYSEDSRRYATREVPWERPSRELLCVSFASQEDADFRVDVRYRGKNRYLRCVEDFRYNKKEDSMRRVNGYAFVSSKIRRGIRENPEHWQKMMGVIYPRARILFEEEFGSLEKLNGEKK